MSRPISNCLIAKAARNEGNARELLAAKVDYALEHGAFTQIPCECDPKCVKPSEEQVVELLIAVPSFAILIAKFR